ncbi:hypothetical protein A7981_00580 [Methylovorus sp. MM2]|uniref:hypothetical protein n=1 Tax=Methylovorus sp. MM2 TaxID=1848038 RepID=UPI0007E1769F|nr:hypothetical protein [Methylovorus sp. MM2]OAM52023.1 hypothetical protein A7981_00580 [Methylovorus sp. MM2]
MAATKLIIGSAPQVDLAIASWQEIEPDLEIIGIRLQQDNAYRFDLSELDAIDAKRCTAFVAFDDQFLNFRRYELMAEIKSRGFKMPPLICQGTLVAKTTKVGENSFIGSGAIIDHHCQIGYNVVIGAGTNIGSNTVIAHSAWIAPGVVIGAQVKVSANATLGHGVIVTDHIEIGKLSVVDKPGKFSQHIPAKTFIYAAFDEDIVIVENRNANTHSLS